MLRRAKNLGGFHQVIFVGHTPLVWELVDRILSVGDGRVVSGNSEGQVAKLTENGNASVWRCCPRAYRRPSGSHPDQREVNLNPECV